MSHYRKKASLFGVLLAISILSAACSVGPDFVSPATRAPNSWNAGLYGNTITAAAEPEALAKWWMAFNDPILAGLVERAATHNLDVRQAQARVLEARARRGLSITGYLPSLNADGAVAVSGTGDNSVARRTLYSAGFDAGWEIDIFGGTRRAVEAAEANLQAGELDLSNVRVTLVAEVALNYTELRLNQKRLAIVKSQIAALEEIYAIVLAQSTVGLADSLSERQAKRNLESTKAAAPEVDTSIRQSFNRLAVLLGEPPGALDQELAPMAAIPTAAIDIAVGVPAEALRRRPDIARAERQLAAQTAQIGVASADLYPKLSLLGSIGFESTQLDTLVSAKSLTYRYGPSIQWNILNIAAVLQNVDVQNALAQQALAGYEAAVLGALEEVENALAALANSESRKRSLTEAAKAARSTYDLSNTMYRSGLLGLESLLEAQQSLLSIDEQQAASEAAVTNNLIGLYKALGGGWSPRKSER